MNKKMHLALKPDALWIILNHAGFAQTIQYDDTPVLHANS